MGDSGHYVNVTVSPQLRREIVTIPQENRIPTGTLRGSMTLDRFRGLKLISLHFPFDAYRKIEMHAFGFEPLFGALHGILRETPQTFFLRAC